jgi:hypothetical protein
MVEIKGQNAALLAANLDQNQRPENNELETQSLESIAVENDQDKAEQKPILNHIEIINKPYKTQDINKNEKQDKSKLQMMLDEAPPWFQFFRNNLVMGLNTVGIGLNTLSVVATHSNIMPEPVADYLDKAAEWYSRYVVSIGFGWNGVESLAGRRPIEAITRFAPALGFITLPFYNFNLSTGISSTLSYLFDKVVRRNGDKQPGVGSALENTKGVMKHSFDIFKDFFKLDSKESLIERFGLTGLGLGTFGGLLFAANDRDSKVARFFGNLRNLGGIVADYELVFNNDKTWRGNHKRLVGLTCSLASVLNIIARWVDPKLGRTLNHIAIAADDFGLTYWSQMSKIDNDKAATNDSDKILEKHDNRSNIKPETPTSPLLEKFKPITEKNTIQEMHTALAA